MTTDWMTLDEARTEALSLGVDPSRITFTDSPDQSPTVWVTVDTDSDQGHKLQQAGWSGTPPTGKRRPPTFRMYRDVRAPRSRKSFVDHIKALAGRWAEAEELHDRAEVRHRLRSAFASWLGDAHPWTATLVELLAATEHSNAAAVRAKVTGFLNGVAADLETGWDYSVAEVVLVAEYTDLLARAQALHDDPKAGPWPAAVLAGSVLERHLVRMCLARGLTAEKKAGMETLATALYRAPGSGVTQHDLNDVQRWRIIRNAAVHSNEKAFEPERVAEMLTGIRSFIEHHRS